ncbi:4-hydroxy-tetrahydrodipicolinate synthase [Pseudozobellia thermophila]|uniref:4-hydroxy-tetrahydrodipicolinate synthase n=1 Tax=Pseudozobellia thermophila TaxID=192903 RepID=A0A1M6FA47_9FLAO|nr:4-hydroxy-tetrahydrodipicolinate synthase [Pseudozobellia thermophila]SHI94535.1 4-hydroxy-tetrahydrodipicolinate synthase [Pseudozobellia thermophila]
MKELIGTGVALITPFKEDLTIDVDALRKVVDYCIDGGVDYLVVLGTTGESVTLTKEEKQLVMDTVTLANAGRLPLVVGVGGNNTHAVIEELKKLDLTHFEAVLSVSPYYNKPTQEGIFQHFKAIAEASPKPIILYNVPGRTGSNVLPATVVRLARESRNIVAIKEASGNMVQVQELIKTCPGDFQVISGDDATALPTVLAGGAGVISVLGQGLPSEFSQMIRAGLNQQVEEAYKYHYAMQEGMQLIFEEGNPAGIKAIFEILGLARATVRLPLVEASAALKGKIEAFVKPFVKVATS